MDWREMMTRTVAFARLVEGTPPPEVSHSDDPINAMFAKMRGYGSVREALKPLKEFSEHSKHVGPTWEPLDEPERTWEWLAGQWIHIIEDGALLAVNTMLNHTFSSEIVFKEYLGSA